MLTGKLSRLVPQMADLPLLRLRTTMAQSQSNLPPEVSRSKEQMSNQNIGLRTKLRPSYCFLSDSGRRL